MPKIYLLRHAQSEFNASASPDRNHKFRDADLSPLGEKQASNVTGEFDLVILSPMRRARRTLELSQIKYKEVRIVDDARELRSVECDYLEEEDIPPYRESPTQMNNRMKQLKEYIIKEAVNDIKLLVVSHVGTILYLTSENLDTIGGIRANNAEIIEYDLQ